jgi:hypothetical protein
MARRLIGVSGIARGPPPGGAIARSAASAGPCSIARFMGQVAEHVTPIDVSLVEAAVRLAPCSFVREPCVCRGEPVDTPAHDRSERGSGHSSETTTRSSW